MVRNGRCRSCWRDSPICSSSKNVGNLICTAEFAGVPNVVVASSPEGHDKPYKYPGML